MWLCAVQLTLAALDDLPTAGASLEADYPYEGLDDFCRVSKPVDPTSAPVRFKGYVSVPSRDDEALMEASYMHGPIAVSVDAELESFRCDWGGSMDCASA